MHNHAALCAVNINNLVISKLYLYFIFADLLFGSLLQNYFHRYLTYDLFFMGNPIVVCIWIFSYSKEYDTVSLQAMFLAVLLPESIWLVLSSFVAIYIYFSGVCPWLNICPTIMPDNIVSIRCAFERIRSDLTLLMYTHQYWHLQLKFGMNFYWIPAKTSIP